MIQELLSLVHYKTFLRWVREEKAGQGRKGVSRPPVSQNVQELILRFGRETDWGYARIQDELKKLGINIAHNTIKKVLIKNGFQVQTGRRAIGTVSSSGTWTPYGPAISLQKTYGPGLEK